MLILCLYKRWSPRAFEKTSIDDATLERIMQAARLSPSCFNAQPWRIYTSTDATFDDYLNLLVEGNQGWAKDTSVLGFMVATLKTLSTMANPMHGPSSIAVLLG